MNNDYFKHQRRWDGASQVQCDSAPQYLTQAKAEETSDAIVNHQRRIFLIEIGIMCGIVVATLGAYSWLVYNLWFT